MNRFFGRSPVVGRPLSRRGFTLVELLVVIAIIGTLVALLMPAVQSARESARRMSCGNNLHNLALAVQNYHDSVGSFPSGYVIGRMTSGGAVANVESWGWGALILPFIEQKNLHDQIGVTRFSLADSIKSNPKLIVPTIQSPIPIFMCPSDTGFNGRGQVHNNRNFTVGEGFAAAGLTTAAQALVGVSNYIGVEGHRDIADAGVNTGLFFGNSYVRMSDVIDGTSNTFLIGERDTINCRSGAWVGVRNPNAHGSRGVVVVVGHSRPKLNQPEPPIVWSQPAGCGEGFSSMHPNGAQFASVDGAVRFVSSSINHNWIGTDANMQGSVNDSKDQRNGVYQRLMTRNDKLTVADFQ